MPNYMTRVWFTLLLLIFSSAAARGGDASLWVSKCEADEGICDTQEIVRYDFLKGELKATETVFASKTLDIRFDLDDSRILDNRFLISDSGNVIDLKTKQVLHQSEGKLLLIRGKKLIIEVNRVDEEGIFAFDLETARYEKLRDLKDWPDLSGEHFSPDGKLAATPAATSINFFTVDEKFSLKFLKAVKGKEFEAYCSVRCSSTPILPYLWIDNTTVLTQRTNGEIVTVSLSGAVRNIAKIPLENGDGPDSLPHFSRDEFGNFSYYLDGTEYFIDLGKKKVSTQRIPIGAGFSRTEGKIFWSEYFFDGRLIGSVWSGGSAATREYLAVQYAAEGENLGYPDGVKVWNSVKREWLTIPVKWGVQLIGWTGDLPPVNNK